MCGGRFAKQANAGGRLYGRGLNDLPSRPLVFALFTATLFLMAAAPVDAEEGSDDERERYRAQFYSWVGDASPTDTGTVYTSSQTLEVTVEEMADLYADHRIEAMERATKADKASKGRSNQGGSGSSTSAAQTDGPVLGAGSFVLIEALNIRTGNPTVACSDLRENTHYTVAAPVGNDEYVGAAFSNIASQPDAVAEYINDLTGEERYYDVSVYYAGVSDFLCVEIPIAAGQTLLLNLPTVTSGFVIGATE